MVWTHQCLRTVHACVSFLVDIALSPRLISEVRAHATEKDEKKASDLVDYFAVSGGHVSCAVRSNARHAKATAEELSMKWVISLKQAEATLKASM